MSKKKLIVWLRRPKSLFCVKISIDALSQFNGYAYKINISCLTQGIRTIKTLASTKSATADKFTTRKKTQERSTVKYWDYCVKVKTIR